jgi:hypothetical protein
MDRGHVSAGAIALNWKNDLGSRSIQKNKAGPAGGGRGRPFPAWVIPG